MEIIHLRQTLPQVFADRDAISSDVWHQDLVLQKGERYLIEAASGTGKSSLCSYIYGYRRDYQGIINFDERNIRSLSIHEWVELRKHSLSMLFQELRIFPELTALENVQLKNRLTNYKKKKEILALFETLMGRILTKEAEQQGAGVVVTSIGKHIELEYNKVMKL
jgi:ABC-type lipoprotein export system ATPase subunit